MSIELTPEEYSLCKSQARRVASKWKAASREDLEGDLLLWCCENYHHVERYRTEQGGRSKLAKALYRFGLGIAMKQQEARNGKRLQDEWSPYTKQQVKAALPYVFDPSEWPMGQATIDPRHGGLVSMPDPRTGEALAVLIDVRAAVLRLNDREHGYLRARFRDGLSTREVADLHDLPPGVMSRRLWDAVDKVHKFLSESAYRGT